MPLTVLSVAYPFSPVSPGTAGGAEQILGALDGALTARGDLSVVVAAAGSSASGRLYPAAIPDGMVTARHRVWARRRMQAAIDRVLREHAVDLIHMHGLDFTEYTLPPQVPVLVTLHLPIAWYGEALLGYRHPRRHLCCVSQVQHRTSPPELGPVHVIENGVELPPGCELPEPVRISGREPFAVVLGRICPEKNQHAALIAGTQAGLNVVLAGKVFPYPEHQAYFDHEVKPLLGPQPSGACHSFVGPIEPAARTELLARARCLLHPTLAPETSSLVAMEALAAGTPVIAFRSGALPEIVSDGETGFLVNTAAEMGAAIGRLPQLFPARCRDQAALRFDRIRMIGQYFSLYDQIVGSERSARYG